MRDENLKQTNRKTIEKPAADFPSKVMILPLIVFIDSQSLSQPTTPKDAHCTKNPR